jgi:hypothetical protein
MEKNFGISLAFERVMLKISLAKFLVVVDFAVENDVNRSVIVAHRLRACISRIEDRQAAMGKKDLAIMKDTFSVRTTMSHRLSHIFPQVGVSLTVKRTFTRYSTHYQLVFVSGAFISHPIGGFIHSLRMFTEHLDVFTIGVSVDFSYIVVVCPEWITETMRPHNDL